MGEREMESARSLCAKHNGLPRALLLLVLVLSKRARESALVFILFSLQCFAFSCTVRLAMSTFYMHIVCIINKDVD